MTRTKDVFISLNKRAQIANKYRNALFVSIHLNSAEKGNTKANGIETFYISNSGKTLAGSIQKELLTSLNAKNRKAKYNTFHVLEKTNCPAVLVECGFISNYYERQQCRRSWYHSLCAASIARGIVKYKKSK